MAGTKKTTSKKNGSADNIFKEQQIVSKDRVSDAGEVYTAKSEVKAMVDLVAHEAERIESTFLEPACGNGNFLIEILERKLNVVFKKYRKSQTECEKYLVVAVGSIYGIDILPDNVENCRERLFKLFRKQYRQKCKSYCSEEFEMIIRYIIEKNVVYGDALTMKDPATDEPIVFTEWTIPMGCKVKRREFQFKEIVRVGGNISEANKNKNNPIQQKTLDIETNIIESFIDQPVCEYNAVHYMDLLHSLYGRTTV